MRNKKDSFRHKADYFQRAAKMHLAAGRFGKAQHCFARFMKCQTILGVICAMEIDRDMAGNAQYYFDGAPA